MPKTNSYDYSDYEKFGIKNDVERCIVGGWLMLVVICSLLGDSIILIASIKYKAFNLHRIVVAFIQHIAVCDLINASLSVRPIAVSVFYHSSNPKTTRVTATRIFITPRKWPK